MEVIESLSPVGVGSFNGMGFMGRSYVFLVFFIGFYGFYGMSLAVF